MTLRVVGSYATKLGHLGMITVQYIAVGAFRYKPLPICILQGIQQDAVCSRDPTRLLYGLITDESRPCWERRNGDLGRKYIRICTLCLRKISAVYRLLEIMAMTDKMRIGHVAFRTLKSPEHTAYQDVCHVSIFTKNKWRKVGAR